MNVAAKSIVTNFAVLHTSKYKSLGAIGRHIDRKRVTNNVDRTKTDFNGELIKNPGPNH